MQKLSSPFAQKSFLSCLLAVVCLFFCQALAVTLPPPQQEIVSKPAKKKHRKGYAPAFSNPRIISGTFITAFGGPSRIDWDNFSDSIFTSTDGNGTGGSVYGFAAGYRFYSYFAIEGGFIRLPTVSGTGFTNITVPPALASVEVESWLGYMIGRFYASMPFCKYLYMTAGVGVTYRQVEPRPLPSFTNNNSYYYSPIFNLGLEFDFLQDWFVFMNYYYVLKYVRELAPQETKKFNTPAANLVVFGLGYKLSV